MLVGAMEPRQLITAVDLTIDGLLVLANKLDVTADFPMCLGIHNNICDLDLRAMVWAAVTDGLTAQEILDNTGAVHPEVEAMIRTVTRAERTLEGRWYHTGADGRMTRFAICRHEEMHVIIVRAGDQGDRVVIQRTAARTGLAGMVEAVIGQIAPAPITSPIMGPVAEIQHAAGPEDLARYGADSRSASALLSAVANPESWVEIVATERLPGGTIEQPQVAAGVLDSNIGRVVSIPRSINNTLYGSFAAGNTTNLARAVTELVTFLPSGMWDTPR
jgi:EspG family